MKRLPQPTLWEKLTITPRYVRKIQKDIYWQDEDVTESIYYEVYEYPSGGIYIDFYTQGQHLRGLGETYPRHYMPEIENIIRSALERIKNE